MTEEQQARISSLNDLNRLRHYRKVRFTWKAAFYITLAVVQMVAAYLLFPESRAAFFIGSIPLVFGFICLLLSGYYSWRMTESVDLRNNPE